MSRSEGERLASDRIISLAVSREGALWIGTEEGLASWTWSSSCAAKPSVGVSIRTTLAAEPPAVTADRVQLQQVLMNLILNGIEAMGEWGGQLTVTTPRDVSGDLLCSVVDTGVGLPAEKGEEIFQPFVTTKPQGTGMGLAICRSIIESHGGRLWATPNEGRGATFHFTLPVGPSRDVGEGAAVEP